LSPAESPPPRHSSPLPHTHNHARDGNYSHAFPRRRSTSIRPNALFQRRPRAHSITGAAPAFKASIHNNPYLASRCRTLKSQIAHLKQKLEELMAVIEELQPEHSAMDWAASAGTIIYVPVRVTKDNEAPRASPAPPEVRGPEESTFPDVSQYFGKTDGAFGSGRATDVSVDMGGQQGLLQRDVLQPTSRSWEAACEMGTAAQTGSAAEPPIQVWTSPFVPTFSCGSLGGQPATATTGIGVDEAARPRNTDTAPPARWT
jgi:hypothetical protein